MKILAHAKLNLTLRVTGRRADGFHELDSHVLTIDLSDRITLSLNGRALEISNTLGIPVEADLAARAARLLLAEKARAFDSRIHVEKRIPAGAGFGGGSSDAAAVLVALDRLTPPRLPRAKLTDLAAQLGSDVPLFLLGGSIRMLGRGESVTRVPPPPERHFVIVAPRLHSDTAAVYTRYDELADSGAPSLILDRSTNDLAAAALDLYPELRPIQEAIASLGSACAGLTGSGAAFFAGFAEAAEAKEAAGRLIARLPDATISCHRTTDSGHTLQEES